MVRIHEHAAKWYIGRNPVDVPRKEPFTGSMQQTQPSTRRIYRDGFWTGDTWVKNYGMAMAFETREAAQAYLDVNEAMLLPAI